MERVRDGINGFLFATNDILHGWRVWLVDFLDRDLNKWFVLFVIGAAVLVLLLHRREVRSRHERSLLTRVAEGLAEGSSPPQLISLFFDTLFKAVEAHAACFYLAASRGSSLILQAKRMSLARAAQPGALVQPTQAPAARSAEHTWEPDVRIETIRTEPWIAQKGLQVVSFPLRIEGQPLALVQVATLSVTSAERIKKRAVFLRALLTPVLAQFASVERIQRLEERSLEASVVSGASQTLLNTTLGPDELGTLLLDLVSRATESDAGLIVLGADGAGRPGNRLLASVAIEPGPLQDLLAAIGPRPLPLPAGEAIVDLPGSDSAFESLLGRAGFRALLQVPIGSDATPLGAIVLAKRSPGFRGNHLRICQLNATRLALSLRNRAYHEAVFNEYKEMLAAMVATHESGSHYLDGHSRRVSRIASDVADVLGLGLDEADGIRFAAELHDVGMVGLGEEILLKPSRLTKQEYDLVKYHPVIGAALTTPIRLPIPVAPLILHHHERYDGLGYPTGLKGAEIPLGARILALGEVFDAMLTPRNYRDALALPEALSRLRPLAGTQLDPKIVDVFVQTMTAERWRAIAGQESSRPA